MSAVDFRRLVETAELEGVALEVDDPRHERPLVLSALGVTNATTLRLTLDEGRALFDALAEALGLVTVQRAAEALGDTPTRRAG